MHAFCVSATETDLPPSDRIAHLLLALRVEEEGFATVAKEVEAGNVELLGDAEVARSMQKWLGLSPFAKEKSRVAA